MYSRTIVELEGKIRTQEQSLGEDHPQIADTLGQLAHLYFMFDRAEDAERSLWRAITICGKWFGQENLATAGWLHDLGYMYETQNRWSQAEHVYRLAYAIQCVNLGSTHRESMQTARAIISCCRAQGKNVLERELERMAKVGN
jgi:hypothetical protein